MLHFFWKIRWEKRKNLIFLNILKFWKFSIFVIFFSIFEILDFSKKMKNFKTFSYFFIFLNEIFIDFNNFWCSEKLKLSSLQKVVCLFMKYASLGLCIADFEIILWKNTDFFVKSTFFEGQVSKSALECGLE